MSQNTSNGTSGLVSPGVVTLTAIQDHIPYYLTLDQKEALANALNRIPSDYGYYLVNKFENDLLQGDGWTKLQVLRFDTGERKEVTGIIFSNACDVTCENTRDLPPNIVFAPIMKLLSYVNLLREAGLDANRLNNKISSIKAQNVTTIFYLPNTIGGLGDEHIVLLDDVHTVPIRLTQTPATCRVRPFAGI